MILTPLQKLPNNVGNLGKIIVATAFEWLTQTAKNRPIWSQWGLASMVSVFTFDKKLQNCKL